MFVGVGPVHEAEGCNLFLPPDNLWDDLLLHEFSLQEQGGCLGESLGH